VDLWQVQFPKLNRKRTVLECSRCLAVKSVSLTEIEMEILESKCRVDAPLRVLSFVHHLEADGARRIDRTKKESHSEKSPRRNRPRFLRNKKTQGQADSREFGRVHSVWRVAKRSPYAKTCRVAAFVLRAGKNTRKGLGSRRPSRTRTAVCADVPNIFL